MAGEKCHSVEETAMTTCPSSAPDFEVIGSKQIKACAGVCSGVAEDTDRALHI